MTSKDIITRLRTIAADQSLSLDDRIDMIFDLRESEAWDSDIDIECFKILIDAVRSEDALATNVRDLLQLYVLLAETYVGCELFRPLEKLSCEVREILRDDRIAWEVIDETVPRIIDAMSDTVYHHETYRLILVYLNKALSNDRLSKDLKEYAVNFLKLRILLDDPYNWHDHLMTKEMKAAIAALFSPEELLRIILKPEIGHLKCDPVEYTYQWEDIYYDVEDYLKNRFANVPRRMGFCFKYWSAKRDYLKENYNIDWHSPSQMNPRVRFD